MTRAYTASSLAALEASHDALRANLRRMLNLIAQIGGEDVATYKTYHDAKRALQTADHLAATGGEP
jgi:hypothetical protein